MIQILFICSLMLQIQSNNVRQLEYNGTTVNTTFEIDDIFYGKYQGNRKGYLQLNRDGSGVYKYDYVGLSKGCPGELIEFNWGFALDENSEIIKAKRPYGYSYPIIYNCSGDNAFRNCTERVMVDYILVYDDGTITVSSSDDWKKKD